MSVEQGLQRAQFAHLIPHASDMVLIDRVDAWSERFIDCATNSHRSLLNPLRHEGVLSAIHLLEYGAQVMAIHGGLLSGRAMPGYLAAVRAAHFYVETLDEVTSEILIKAKAELNANNGAIYQFSVQDSHDQLLLRARATVINTL